ncbi:MAG: zinc ribbon domain-containing protein [Akkermansiaceae bacterium]
MLDEIRALLILQDREQRLIRLQKDLAMHSVEEERAKAKLAGDTAGLEKANEELKAAELKVKKVEMDVETRKTTIQRLKIQQFETKKNDEYNALGNEIVRYEKEVDELETQELEAMEEVDAFKEKQAVAKQLFERTQKVVDEDLVTIKERHVNMEQQLKETEEERDKLAQEVSEDLLPLYKRLMKSKDGHAIATLKAGKCTGCHMKVIASTAIALQQEKEITQCENCGRILSIDE